MNDLILFLKESNAIEDVWDEQSLTNAKKAWDYLIKQKELTTKNILRTHEILMKDKLDKDNLGHWRKQPVWIGGHEAKPWFAIPDLMEQWIKVANHGAKIKDEDVAKNDHMHFESIHPFIDGNGRMGRILLNWQRVKVGLPILVIKEAEKWGYYSWFSEK